MTFGRMDIVGEDLLGELTPSTKPMAGTQGDPNDIRGNGQRKQQVSFFRRQHQRHCAQNNTLRA